MSKPDFVWDGRKDYGEDARISVIPGSAASDLRLSGLHFRILAHLGRFNHRKGWCILSQTELAKHFQVTRQSVNKAIGELVSWGYVAKKTQEDTGESHCRYRAILDDEGVSGKADTPPQGVSGKADTSVKPKATRVSPLKDTHYDIVDISKKKASPPVFEKRKQPSGSPRDTSIPFAQELADAIKRGVYKPAKVSA